MTATTPTDPPSVTPRRTLSAYLDQLEAQWIEKERIARAAAQPTKPNDPNRP